MVEERPVGAFLVIAWTTGATALSVLLPLDLARGGLALAEARETVDPAGCCSAFVFFWEKERLFILFSRETLLLTTETSSVKAVVRRVVPFLWVLFREDHPKKESRAPGAAFKTHSISSSSESLSSLWCFLGRSS